MNRLAILHQQLKKVIGGKALPFLSIANNMFTVREGENAQNISAMDKTNGNVVYVDLHVVDASPYMSKQYYPGDYDPDADPIAPTCYSNDGFKPAEDVTEKQCEFCAQCPHNAWGSKITALGKRGKACNDAWKIATIIPEFHAEKLFQMRIPPASLQSWLAYIAQFNDHDHPSEDRKLNAMDVITRAFFESGKTGILGFMPISIFTPDADEMIIAQNFVDSKQTEIFIGVDNIDSEKREEMLALATPTSAPQLTDQRKPAPQAQVTRPAAKIAAPVQQEVEEDGEAEDEAEEATEEVAAPKVSFKKSSNAILPSENMRTKQGTGKVAATTALPAGLANGKGKVAGPAAPAKPAVAADVKNMLTNLMKLT